MDQINFKDFELKKLEESTGLSRLELLGVIGEMNKIWVPKIRYIRDYDGDERMGRHI